MQDQGSKDAGFWRSRAGITLLVFLGTVGFLLGYEHRAHIPGGYWLLGGLFLACLLMHRFMHGDHGGHGNGRTDDEPPGRDRS